MSRDPIGSNKMTQHSYLIDPPLWGCSITMMAHTLQTIQREQPHGSGTKFVMQNTLMSACFTFLQLPSAHIGLQILWELAESTSSLRKETSMFATSSHCSENSVCRIKAKGIDQVYEGAIALKDYSS